MTSFKEVRDTFSDKWQDYYYAACEAIGVVDVPRCAAAMAIKQSSTSIPVMLMYGEPGEELLRAELSMKVHPAYDDHALSNLALIAARLVPAVQRTGPTNVSVELNSAEKMEQWLVPLAEHEP